MGAGWGVGLVVLGGEREGVVSLGFKGVGFLGLVKI